MSAPLARKIRDYIRSVGTGDSSLFQNLSNSLSTAALSGIVARISWSEAGLNCRSNMGGPVVYDPEDEVWSFNRLPES
jgi:hypothetical protein